MKKLLTKLLNTTFALRFNTLTLVLVLIAICNIALLASIGFELVHVSPVIMALFSLFMLLQGICIGLLAHVYILAMNK